MSGYDYTGSDRSVSTIVPTAGRAVDKSVSVVAGDVGHMIEGTHHITAQQATDRTQYALELVKSYIDRKSGVIGASSSIFIQSQFCLLGGIIWTFYSDNDASVLYSVVYSSTSHEYRLDVYKRSDSLCYYAGSQV